MIFDCGAPAGTVRCSPSFMTVDTCRLLCNAPRTDADRQSLPGVHLRRSARRMIGRGNPFVRRRFALHILLRRLVLIALAAVGLLLLHAEAAEAQRKAQRRFPCPPGYEEIRTRWPNGRTGRSCRRPSPPTCRWDQNGPFWRGGRWVCVQRPVSGNGIPSSKSDGHAEDPNNGVGHDPTECPQTGPDGKQWPGGGACAYYAPPLITIDLTRSLYYP